MLTDTELQKSFDNRLILWLLGSLEKNLFLLFGRFSSDKIVQNDEKKLDALFIQLHAAKSANCLIGYKDTFLV